MYNKEFNNISDLDLLEKSLQGKNINLTQLANCCGISRQQLYNRMKKLNITKQDLQNSFNYVKKLIMYDNNYKFILIQQHLEKIKNAIELSKRNPNISINIDYEKEFKELISFLDCDLF